MNWFYDPEAIRLCLAADWKSQIVVPDDLARNLIMTSSILDRLRERESTAISELILADNTTFESRCVWDVVVPAIFLNPDLIIDLQTRYLTVDSTPGLNSGRAVSWTQHEHNNMETGEGMPKGIKPVKIVMQIDEEHFWDMYVDLLTQQ